MRFKERKSLEINIDLWPSGHWSRKELKQFIEVIKDFGSTSGQLSSNVRGAELQICITFVTAAIAAGFFAKLGSDLYDFLKIRLKELLLKSRTRFKKPFLKQIFTSGKIAPTLDLEVEGRLRFVYCETEMDFDDVVYTCFYSNEFELDTFFSSLYQIDTLIRKGRHSRLFPFDKGQGYSIYATLEIRPQPTWKVEVKRYAEEDEKKMKWFVTRITFTGLDKLNWKQLDWQRLIFNT